MISTSAAADTFIATQSSEADLVSEMGPILMVAYAELARSRIHSEVECQSAEPKWLRTACHVRCSTILSPYSVVGIKMWQCILDVTNFWK